MISCSGRIIHAAPAASPHLARRRLYAQPDWLIDREKLAGRFPPRVRARELWRVAPRVPRAGAGRRHAPRHPRPGARRARHHHRRRDAPRELLQPLRHRARRRRHRQPGHRARPQRPPEPGAARRRPDPPQAPGRGRATSKFLRAQHRPHDQDHRAGPVHDVAAGAERLLHERGGAGPRLRRRGQRGDPGPVRRRRRHRADRRAVHAGAAREGARSTAWRRSTARSTA